MKSGHSKQVILRIFRVEIDPLKRTEFEEAFFSESVASVIQIPGSISCDIGMPTKWSPNAYIMLSKWTDESALFAFAGDNWNEPVIPKGMEHFSVNCSVEHYLVAEG
jgi:quinol monooxygenase YgiN